MSVSRVFLRSLGVLSRQSVARASARALPAAARPAAIPIAFRGYASGPDPISSSDSKLQHAQSLLEDGTHALEQGDVQKAKDLYQQSANTLPTSGAYFNLGVCEYQLQNLPAAIEAWKQSIKLEPSADAYTNLGSAYMMSQPPNAPEAIKALTAALEIAPEDPEIQYNLAAILEATNSLEQALKLYKKAHSHGIERAATNVRNVGAKILAQRMKEEEEKQQKDK